MTRRLSPVTLDRVITTVLFLALAVVAGLVFGWLLGRLLP